MNMVRTVLITGGATRVGHTIALHLAANGWDVAVHYCRSKAEAEQTAGEIRALGCRAATIQGNLETTDASARIIQAASAALGPLTALVNNAARFERDSLATLDAEGFHAHMNTNLLAPLLLSQAFSAQLVGGRQGAIVNILDGCEGLCLSPNFLSYTLSKHALHDATLLLAKGLAPQVRVNAVAPGLTLPKAGEEEMFDRLSAKQPGIVTPPEGIAATVLSLLEQDGATGQVVSPSTPEK